jgi:dimethylamine monooxygenase subunit B
VTATGLQSAPRQAAAGTNALHPALASGLKLQVTEVTAQTPSITSITFTDPAGRPLRPYVPGSHLLVQCGDGINAYSLTGSGKSPSDYSVSVLRVASGAGGSAAMHRLRAGDPVLVSRPRSAFAPMATARHQLLVAGGIGVTPMLSHARAAAEQGTPASMLYMHRAREGAHVPELRELLGTSFVECTDRGSFRQALEEKLSSQRLGTHLYACGPAAFMESVLASARELGWPEARLHSEPFGTPEL